MISPLSAAGPYAELMPMHPRPRAETSRFCPRVRFCIASPLCCAALSLLAIYKALKLRRISVSLNIDCRDGIVNGLQIVRRQFYACAANVLFEAVKLRGSRYRHD